MAAFVSRFHAVLWCLAALATTASAQAVRHRRCSARCNGETSFPNRGGRTTTGVGVPGKSAHLLHGSDRRRRLENRGRGRNLAKRQRRILQDGSVGSIAVFDANPSIVYVGHG